MRTRERCGQGIIMIHTFQVLDSRAGQKGKVVESHDSLKDPMLIRGASNGSEY